MLSFEITDTEQSIKPFHSIENNTSIMASSNGNIFVLLTLCWGNPSVTGGFPSQRPVTRNLNVFFDMRRNKQNLFIYWSLSVIYSKVAFCLSSNLISWNCRNSVQLQIFAFNKLIQTSPSDWSLLTISLNFTLTEQKTETKKIFRPNRCCAKFVQGVCKPSSQKMGCKYLSMT